MWGEINFKSRTLIIEPLLWNDDQREFAFESVAAPQRLRVDGRDAFEYPLPGSRPARFDEVVVELEGMAEAPQAFVAEGWEVIDATILEAKTATPPSVEEMSDWFDGMFPRWEVATAHGVRPRQLVDDLVRQFQAAHGGSPEPLVKLLTGAGGEGKSAALLQTAAGLIRSDKNWSCLSRTSTSAPLPPNPAELLPARDDHAWIIAIDDAESVAGGLPDLLRTLQPRTDVHVILAARDADWNLRGHTDAMWQGLANFRRQTISGLDQEDANRIAESWVAFGPEAMGRLGSMTKEESANALLGHAQEFAAKQEEGALLGALLIAREGDDLRNRVIRLMSPWIEAAGIEGKTLLDIYSMIAAMHSENQLYLSRSVLAFALGCSEDELDLGPLRVLRKEAMVGGGSAYVLTRHRMIAEVACQWLAESGYRVDQIFAILARAAIAEQKEQRSWNPDLADWRFGLSRHFIERGSDRWGVARSIAKALFDYDSSDVLYLTNYAGTLRRTNQPVAALKLFRESGELFMKDRGVLYEWGVTAAGAGDPRLAAWLSARSIADIPRNGIDTKQAKMSLAGMGAAFRELAKKPKNDGFKSAQAACGRLGLKLTDLDQTTLGYFEEHRSAEPKSSNVAPSEAEDLATVAAAVINASYDVDPENDPQFYADHIQEPDEYRYTALAALLTDGQR